MLVAPSGAGNTVLLTDMILDIYSGCFSRTYIWSPSIYVDKTWEPVKDYIRDHTKPNGREKCYCDEYDPSELEQLINTQQKVISYQKKENIKMYIQFQSLLAVLPITPISHESLNFYIS